MSIEYKAERTVSTIFKTESQVEQAIRRLIERGVAHDHISVMGRNFQSQTRIAGFISKRDVILGGLRSGAIFGSLFGSFLSLLSGVGVLFIPFVGPVVAAGPIGALLLGATSGALAGSAGAGLVSALVSLGMPEQQATVYQTRLEAGEFVLMVEVPSDRVGEYQLILESLGGEDLHTSEAALPRACPGRCNSPEELAPEVRNHLSPEAQTVFIHSYNDAIEKLGDDVKAEQMAWQHIHQQFDEDQNGVWSKSKVAA